VPPPLVVHVVYRFDTGGLENGVVNLVNRLPREAFRHRIVALTEAVPAFCRRVRRDDVEFVSLHKPPGHGVRLYPRLYRLFRTWRPAVVHTRNLAALEAQVPAWAAGVPLRVHGEHGRDVEDLDGSSVRHQRMRRLYRPFVHRYVALSKELAGYLEAKVHVPRERIAQVYNGVDASRFAPAEGGVPAAIPGCPFDPARHRLVGTVGRMQAVKDTPALVRAFAEALRRAPALAATWRLVLVGDGPLRAECERLLHEAGLAALAWLPGERADVPDVMRGLSLFVLPSRAEGVSNTILEAMASGVPVLATDVGGNRELLDEGRTGWLVPAGDPAALATALVHGLQADAARTGAGRAARAEVEQRFALDAMAAAYAQVYRWRAR
jgi:sugar transferase (PEP-CTERM/EpsH1 system associated)